VLEVLPALIAEVRARGLRFVRLEDAVAPAPSATALRASTPT